jgi:hypothetical protein
MGGVSMSEEVETRVAVLIHDVNLENDGLVKVVLKVGYRDFATFKQHKNGIALLDFKNSKLLDQIIEQMRDALP